jgi:hypothetical protein
MPEIGPIFYFRASARRRRCSLLRLLRIVFAFSLGIVGWAFASHCDKYSASATMLLLASPRAQRARYSSSTRCMGVGRPGSPVRWSRVAANGHQRATSGLRTAKRRDRAPRWEPATCGNGASRHRGSGSPSLAFYRAADRAISRNGARRWVKPKRAPATMHHGEIPHCFIPSILETKWV